MESLYSVYYQISKLHERRVLVLLSKGCFSRGETPTISYLEAKGEFYQTLQVFSIETRAEFRVQVLNL